MKEEKSKLKGISLEPEQVAEFVDSLPIIAQVVLSMDEMYGSLLDEEDDGYEKIIKHKEKCPQGNISTRKIANLCTQKS